MRTLIKTLVSILLAVSMLLCSTLPAFAVGDEEYLSELRIVYADTYQEALDILADSAFKDYKLLNENLNADTGETGAWLAYKTTTDIEDAITDIAVMQMGGGYKDGNFQQMIKESYQEYVEMGETYLDAIDYFVDAYDAGDFLAESAYRQLNFYTVETQTGIGLEIPHYEGELLGDIFYDGIDEYELATMFFQGNSYALKNIRSLISMGVSYNEDGKTYLEKVAETAAAMKQDPTVYDGEDYDDIAETLILSLSTIRDTFNELEDHEGNLDYSDEEFTEEEIRYLEVKAIADTMREINYRGEQSVYDFFMRFDYNKDGIKSIYPLVAALNEGQVAMTKVAHYYDVLRYSAAVVDEEVIEEELEKMEEVYAENPFNIYTGVDRSIYNGTFALTTDAYRADAYAEIDLMDQFLGTAERKYALEVTQITAYFGITLLALGCVTRYIDHLNLDLLVAAYDKSVNTAIEAVATSKAFTMTFGSYSETWADGIGYLFSQYLPGKNVFDYTFAEQISMLRDANITNYQHYEFVRTAQDKVLTAKSNVSAAPTSAPVSMATGAFFVVGGALMIYSAYNILSTVYHYYNPEYEDIPVAMVDLIETLDGDRYIKYDVVYEAEAREEGKYSAADLNVFEGQRWNALYYTKSYEAGKPLLADEFVVSHQNNTPKTNYAPIHSFGSTVCYNLNQHNFDDDTSIYLSVKQSKNDKSAVADVPEVVGSMFGRGFLFLAGGIGLLAGIGGTFATQGMLKKKKSKADAES